MRRKRLDASVTIHYVSQDYERKVGNGAGVGDAPTKYYRALGRLVVLRRGGTLLWAGTDHLGPTVRVAGTGFIAIDQLRY